MSQAHIDAFIDDARTIKASFDGSSGSLKFFMQWLRRRAHNPRRPTPADLVEISELLSMPGAPKYLPAAKRLLTVWGRPRAAYPSASALPSVTFNRICFRGDSRTPDIVFKNGFDPLKADGAFAYRGNRVAAEGGFGTEPGKARIDRDLKPIEGLTKSGDIDPDRAVCVSTDIDVAALFPLPKNARAKETLKSWIYVVFVETGAATNTRQVLDALDGLSELARRERNGLAPLAARRDMIVSALYGRELAALKIPPERVLAAVKVKRAWHQMVGRVRGVGPIAETVYDADYTKGGTYRLLELRTNDGAETPSGFEDALADFFKGFAHDVKRKRSRRLPVVSDGILKSRKT